MTFVASLAAVIVMIAATGAYAAVLGWFGQPDWGPIYGGYLGLVLLGATLVAIASRVSRNSARCRPRFERSENSTANGSRDASPAGTSYPAHRMSSAIRPSRSVRMRSA